MDSKTFKNLKRWRLGGLEPEKSQIQIAKEVGATNTKVSLVEGGLVLDEAERKVWARAYGVSVEEFERLNAGLSRAEWDSRVLTAKT